MHASWRILCVGALLATVTVSCGLSESAGECLPAPLQVQPYRAHAGDDITVSSGAFACDRSYPRGKTYSVQLGLVGRSAPIPLGEVPVNADGSFTAVVTIPPSASPGESYVIVTGSPFDAPCDDNASCAGYDVALTVLAPLFLH